MIDFVKNISPTEILIFALILMMLFGRKILMNLSRAAGETLKEIKNVTKNVSEVIDESKSDNKKEAS